MASNGDLLVSDVGAATIRRVTPAGVVTTVAGSAGNAGTIDGVGAAARFEGPVMLAIDPTNGDLIVGDYQAHTLRRVTPAGVVSTIAGAAGIAGTADGTGSNARFSNPAGVAVDPQGNILVVDQGSNLLRRISPAGEVTTVAGVADGRRGVRNGALPGHFAFYEVNGGTGGLLRLPSGRLLASERVANQ